MGRESTILDQSVDGKRDKLEVFSCHAGIVADWREYATPRLPQVDILWITFFYPYGLTSSSGVLYYTHGKQHQQPGIHGRHQRGRSFH